MKYETIVFCVAYAFLTACAQRTPGPSATLPPPGYPVAVSKYGIGCTSFEFPREIGPPSYRADDLGKTGVPQLNDDELGILRRIRHFVRSHELRFAFIQNRYFITFDANHGPCESAGGYQVLNAFNSKYEPGENPFVALGISADNPPTPGPWMYLDGATTSGGCVSHPAAKWGRSGSVYFPSVDGASGAMLYAVREQVPESMVKLSTCARTSGLPKPEGKRASIALALILAFNAQTDLRSGEVQATLPQGLKSSPPYELQLFDGYDAVGPTLVLPAQSHGAAISATFFLLFEADRSYILEIVQNADARQVHLLTHSPCCIGSRHITAHGAIVK